MQKQYVAPRHNLTKLTGLGADALLVMPVRWWRFDSPHVAGFIQSQAEDPELFIFPRLDTVHDARHDAAPNRQAVQSDCAANFKGTTEACCTALGIYQKSYRLFGKWVRRVEAGEEDRNFVIYSGAASQVRQKSWLPEVFNLALWHFFPTELMSSERSILTMQCLGSSKRRKSSVFRRLFQTRVPSRRHKKTHYLGHL